VGVAVLAVEVSDLVKRYGRDVVAVDGLDLAIEVGETYGLLGPNGAGKTTTLRILSGLVRPTSGLVRVLGHPAGHAAGLVRVGVMGETAFYPFLSGRDNLRAVARRCGIADRRVDDVLDLVGMSMRGVDRFSTYSLGMKQRLGVAAALLKDPALLILDEPSNGLDPAGQVEMRSLIRSLSKSGRTIVLSSHDMDDVEQLCGRVGVIGGGRMLAEGTPSQLRGPARLWLQADPPRRSAVVAGGLTGVADARLSEGRLSLTLDVAGPVQAADVNRELVLAGLRVSDVRMQQRPLADAFLELTAGRTGGSDSVRRDAQRTLVSGRHRSEHRMRRVAAALYHRLPFAIRRG
jgi:ABC-2 type transport system ATP-binding protein